MLYIIERPKTIHKNHNTPHTQIIPEYNIDRTTWTDNPNLATLHTDIKTATAQIAILPDGSHHDTCIIRAVHITPTTSYDNTGKTLPSPPENPHCRQLPATTSHHQPSLHI